MTESAVEMGGTCPVCGHPMSGHDHTSTGDRLVCPGTCAECSRSLELVVEGAAEDCTVCKGFLDLLGEKPSPSPDEETAMDALDKARRAFERAHGVQQLPETA